MEKLGPSANGEGIKAATATDPDQNETNAAKRILRWIQLIARPALLGGLILVVAAIGAAAWRAGRTVSPLPDSGAQIAKRWKHAEVEEKPRYRSLAGSSLLARRAKRPNWNEPHLSVYSLAALRRPSKTLRDLGDQGQAAAIHFLEEDSGLKGKGWADLEDALKDSDNRVGERDPFRFDRLFVASVGRGMNWGPSDRMMWTRVFVQPINFQFAPYAVVGDNETVKLTSVEDTSSQKLSGQLELAIPGLEGSKASLSPSVEHSIKASSDNREYQKLGVEIKPNSLQIIRESEKGGDAVGNATIPLTVATDPEMIWRRFPNDKLQHPSGDPEVVLVTGTHFDGEGLNGPSAKDERKPAIDILTQVAVPHCALRARVWMLYEERRVEDGKNSYDESDQTVTLLRNALPKEDMEVMSADEVSPAVWSLKLCEDAQCADDDAPQLKAMVPRSEPQSQNPTLWRKVVFTDYGVAIRLAHWLRAHPDTRPPDTGIQFNYQGQSDRNYVSVVPVKRTTKDDCMPAERVIGR